MREKEHGRKMVAPVLITVLLVLFLAAYLCIWTLVPMPVWLRPVLCLALLGLIGVAVWNLVVRIREIRSGEEDDLGQY